MAAMGDGLLGFTIGTILAIFDNRSFGSGEEAHNRFQDGGHGGYLGLPIETILAMFNLQVTRYV